MRPDSEKKAGVSVPAPSDDFEQLILKVREAESRIIRNIKQIEGKISPDNVGKLLISAILEEFFTRMEAMNIQSIGEASGKVATTAAGAVKRHPGPTVLAGLGIGALIVRNMLKQRGEDSKIKTPPKGNEQPQLSHTMERAPRFEDEAAGKPPSLMEGIWAYMDQNPLVVGLMGLSAGLVFGILTSGMGEGNELLDEARRTIRKTAMEMLHGTREKADHVIEAARQAAREEAARQHLM